MDTKIIQLNELHANTEDYLRSCCDSGQPLFVELPDHRLVSIQPIDDTDDDLVNELIENNAEFRAMLARSLAGPREPFLPPALPHTTEE
jgi:hypothetical protein